MNARAILGYLALCGAFGHDPNFERAEILIGSAADTGNSYAKYVLAWIRWRQARRIETHTLLQSSAKEGRFAPAIIDWGRLLQNGFDRVPQNRAAAERLYWLAHRLGNVMALRLLSDMYIRGLAGISKRIVGWILLPISLVRAHLEWVREPFGIRTFLYIPNNSLPVFADSIMSNEVEALMKLRGPKCERNE